ncbi:MAG: DUF3108 domain-containing protein [Bryobacteraceae bacterium]|nr:DUF3108 domain-containing protein [Bryobacteraceae bacterium]
MAAGLWAVAAALAQSGSSLTYSAEWRLIHAGDVRVKWKPGQGAEMLIESTGLVSRLHKIRDEYRVAFDENFCASSAAMRIEEGSRRRETEVRYDAAARKATLQERDLIKDTITGTHEVPLPGPCVHDAIGGLMASRKLDIPVGKSATVPVSDGKRFADVKIEAQEKERVKTPLGTFDTTRYEVFLLNGVIYPRSGRVYVWMTNDARKLPVQIRVRLQLLIGTVTLQLVKDEPQ